MTNGKDRIQKVVWSDILMAQKYSDDFVYEGAQMVGPTSLPARPAIYEVTLTKQGASTANNTLIIQTSYPRRDSACIATFNPSSANALPTRPSTLTALRSFVLSGKRFKRRRVLQIF